MCQLTDIHSLNFIDAVYLLSFIRVAASESLSVFGPLNSIGDRLSPSQGYNMEILCHLLAENLIMLHPDSPSEAFSFENETPFKYDMMKVNYALPTSHDVEKTKDFVSKLDSTFRVNEWWPCHWHEQKLALWRKVALEESLEYLLYVLNQHNLPFSPGAKTVLTLENLLEQYSVAQAHTIIWSAAQKAAAFYQRGGVAKQHAANTVVARIQGYAEKAAAERWDVKQGRRDYNCPQSMISRVLFDTALKIGNKGFCEVPHIANKEVVTHSGDKD